MDAHIPSRGASGAQGACGPGQCERGCCEPPSSFWGCPRPTHAPREAALPQAVRAAVPVFLAAGGRVPLRRTEGALVTTVVLSGPWTSQRFQPFLAPALKPQDRGLAAPPGGGACSWQGAAPGGRPSPRAVLACDRGPTASREYPSGAGAWDLGPGIWDLGSGIWDPALLVLAALLPAQCVESSCAGSRLWLLGFRDGHVEFTKHPCTELWGRVRQPHAHSTVSMTPSSPNRGLARRPRGAVVGLSRVQESK